MNSGAEPLPAGEKNVAAKRFRRGLARSVQEDEAELIDRSIWTGSEWKVKGSETTAADQRASSPAFVPFIDAIDQGNGATKRWRSTRVTCNRQRNKDVPIHRETEQNQRRRRQNHGQGDVAHSYWPSSSISPNFSDQR